MGGWQFIYIGISIALLLFVLYKEYTRRNKRNLALRLLASVIAVSCLTCMALSITYRQQQAAENAAIILTDGYNKDSVAAFTADNKMPAYTFSAFIAAGDMRYKTLHVFGHGLTQDELQQLHNTPVTLHPQNIAAGITAIHWQKSLHVGEKLIIQGSFNNTGNTTVKLMLSGLNTMLDSANIAAGTLQAFQLTTTPKQAGKAVYNITALANDKTIEDELLPVETKPVDSLSILMLSASPGFESNFLKNWLAQNSFRVVARSTTSKGKYDKAFINTPAMNIDKINSQLLSSFDVLVCDADAFAALPKDEQDAVEAGVINGMGLLVNADTLLPSSFFSQTFALAAQQGAPQQNFTLQLNDGSKLHASATPSLFIKPQQGTLPLATDSAGHIFAGIALHGMGKAAVSVFNNTYSWLLAGDKAAYNAYWSSMLHHIAKAKQAISVSFAPTFATVNQPMHITFASNNNPQPIIGGSPVYLVQDAKLPYEWHGDYWPTNTGWQTIQMQGDSVNFYVYGNEDWKAVRAAQRLQATQQYVLRQASSPSAEKVDVFEDKPVNKIWFFIGLMVWCTYLWVERKFNG